MWEARTFLGWGEIDLPSSLGKGGRLVTVSGQVGLAAGMQGGSTALERKRTSGWPSSGRGQGHLGKTEGASQSADRPGEGRREARAEPAHSEEGTRGRRSTGHLALPPQDQGSWCSRDRWQHQPGFREEESGPCCRVAPPAPVRDFPGLSAMPSPSDQQEMWGVLASRTLRQS